MKSVRTVNGVTWIDDAVRENDQVNNELVKILNANCDTLIKRILANLEVYLQYRFDTKPSKDTLNHIRDKLSMVKDSNVDIRNHSELLSDAGTKFKSM